MERIGYSVKNPDFSGYPNTGYLVCCGADTDRTSADIHSVPIPNYTPRDVQLSLLYKIRTHIFHYNSYLFVIFFLCMNKQTDKIGR